MQAGHVQSDYKFLELIGKGGQGKVYKALDTKLKRLVAIKVLSKKIDKQRKGLSDFLYEARLASALDHPNICTIYALIEDETHAFMVMEYVEGKNLFELAYHRPMQIESAVRITMQVTSALIAAHSQGIIHRDIKPRNVMVTTGGQVKILDFGLAKMLENSDGSSAIDLDPAGSPDEDDSEDFLEDIAEGITITIEGAAQGTPASSPPEMALGKPTDWRSDVFSTGVILYLLLTGEYPFYAPTKAEVRDKVVNEEPVPVSVARRSGGPVPLRLIAIVIKALRKKPEERFQTIGDMHDALLSVLREIEVGPETKLTSGVPVSADTESRADAARRGWKFRRKAILAVSMIVGLMLALSLIWYVFTGTARP